MQRSIYHYTLAIFRKALANAHFKAEFIFQMQMKEVLRSALQTVFRNPVGLHLAGKQHPVPSLGAQTIKQLFASLTFLRQSGSS